MSTYLVMASLDFAERELNEAERELLTNRVGAAVEEALDGVDAEVTVAWGEIKPAAEAIEDLRREQGER